MEIDHDGMALTDRLIFKKKSSSESFKKAVDYYFLWPCKNLTELKTVLKMSKMFQVQLRKLFTEYLSQLIVLFIFKIDFPERGLVD